MAKVKQAGNKPTINSSVYKDEPSRKNKAFNRKIKNQDNITEHNTSLQSMSKAATSIRNRDVAATKDTKAKVAGKSGFAVLKDLFTNFLNYFYITAGIKDKDKFIIGTIFTQINKNKLLTIKQLKAIRTIPKEQLEDKIIDLLNNKHKNIINELERKDKIFADLVKMLDYISDNYYQYLDQKLYEQYGDDVFYVSHSFHGKDSMMIKPEYVDIKESISRFKSTLNAIFQQRANERLVNIKAKDIDLDYTSETFPKDFFPRGMGIHSQPEDFKYLQASKDEEKKIEAKNFNYVSDQLQSDILRSFQHFSFKVDDDVFWNSQNDKVFMDAIKQLQLNDIDKKQLINDLIKDHIYPIAMDYLSMLGYSGDEQEKTCLILLLNLSQAGSVPISRFRENFIGRTKRDFFNKESVSNICISKRFVMVAIEAKLGSKDLSVHTEYNHNVGITSTRSFEEVDRTVGRSINFGSEVIISPDNLYTNRITRLYGKPTFNYSQLVDSIFNRSIIDPNLLEDFINYKEDTFSKEGWQQVKGRINDLIRTVKFADIPQIIEYQEDKFIEMLNNLEENKTVVETEKQRLAIESIAQIIKEMQEENLTLLKDLAEKP